MTTITLTIPDEFARQLANFDLLEILKMGWAYYQTKQPLESNKLVAPSRQLERNKIKAEVKVFQAMHAELVKQYWGEYVALHNGQVVDHDPQFEALHGRIRERFGPKPILLRQVTTETERILTMRSPHLERGLA